jgi:uncharacterized protein (DUF2141 family)
MKLAIVAAAWALLGSPPAPAPDLTLHLSSREAGGTLAVAVYSDAEAFRRGEGAIATRTVPRAGAVTTVTFSGLSPGRYAVAAFHDLDGNRDLTLWPIGLPREAYGFSNDVRGQFGPPPFARAAFDLPPSGTVQTLTLR